MSFALVILTDYNLLIQQWIGKVAIACLNKGM